MLKWSIHFSEDVREEAVHPVSGGHVKTAIQLDNRGGLLNWLLLFK